VQIARSIQTCLAVECCLTMATDVEHCDDREGDGGNGVNGTYNISAVISPLWLAQLLIPRHQIDAKKMYFCVQNSIEDAHA
jgi:hypothetical protein